MMEDCSTCLNDVIEMGKTSNKCSKLEVLIWAGIQKNVYVFSDHLNKMYFIVSSKGVSVDFEKKTSKEQTRDISLFYVLLYRNYQTTSQIERSNRKIFVNWRVKYGRKLTLCGCCKLSTVYWCVRSRHRRQATLTLVASYKTRNHAENLENSIRQVTR